MFYSNIKSFVKDSFIRVSDTRCPLRGQLAEKQGILRIPYEGKTFSVMESISSRLEKLLRKKESTGEFAGRVGKGLFFYDFCMAFPEASSLLDQYIVDCVKNYLGKDAFLDSVALFVLPLTSQYIKGKNQSDLWHHDSVGHRIKLFFPICLNLGGSYAPHQYIRGTNLSKWKSYNNPVNSDGERLSFSNVCFDANIEEIPMEFGTAFMIDTNGVHRGLYPAEDSLRCVIQFEFSNKTKGYLPGFVGPVNFELPNICYQKWSELGVLRGNSFSRESDGYIQKGRCLQEHEMFKLVKSEDKV